MDEALVQLRIPAELVGDLGVEPCRASQAAAFTEAFLQSTLKEPSRHDVKTMLSHKAVVLEHFKPEEKKLQSKGSKKAKGLSARQKRDMKIYQISPEHQRYELFLPLHDLWRQYITDLCGGLKPTSSPQFVQQKMVKADLHGAIISVVRSKCSTYVGTSGILLQEFKHVFRIITKEDRLKVIPKRNSVFAVQIDGFISFIYGNRFEQRSSERSAKKFKTRGTIDL